MVPSTPSALARNVMLHWPRPGCASTHRPAMPIGGGAGRASVGMLVPDTGPVEPSVRLPAAPTAISAATIAARRPKRADAMRGEVLDDDVMRSEIMRGVTSWSE
jgi:hypothetical protein